MSFTLHIIQQEENYVSKILLTKGNKSEKEIFDFATRQKVHNFFFLDSSIIFQEKTFQVLLT